MAKQSHRPLIPVDIRRVLTSEAFTQNEIVFDSPGLRLIAAPWEYLFCTKVDRIAQTSNNTLRPYDQTDAIYYLRRHLSCSSISSITLARLRLYFARYRIQWTDQTQQVVAHMNKKGFFLHGDNVGGSSSSWFSVVSGL